MILKNFNKNFLVNLSLVLSIFLLDRFSKIYVINLDKKFLGSEIFTSKFLNIFLIWNEGIAFGLLSFNESIFYNILTIIILGIAFVILFMAIKSIGIKKYALFIILGGAIGNGIDRLFNGHVIDFIDLYYRNFHWPAFNFADSFITVGGVIFFWRIFFKKPLKK